jgi:hypothetical protein
MKRKVNHMKSLSLFIVLVALAAGMLIQSSCASVYGAKKEKHKMVPCPCEKKHNRR